MPATAAMVVRVERVAKAATLERAAAAAMLRVAASFSPRVSLISASGPFPARHWPGRAAPADRPA